MKTHTLQRTLFILSASASVGILTLNTASATNFSWNTGTGNYADGANWTPGGGPPTATDRGYLSNGGTAVLATGTSGLGSLILVSAASTLEVSGGSLTSDTVQLGAANNSTTGTLNFSSGSISLVNAGSGYGYVELGQYVGTTGIVNMSGGTLTSGAGMSVGSVGNGQFNLTGGAVSVGTAVTIGSNAGSVGVLSVSSGTLTTVASNVIVGRAGTGTLNVTGSGIVKSGTAGGVWIDVARNGGSGTLNIGTGGTAGTVVATEIIGGTGTATVNFNHTGSVSFAPLLKGSLIVNKLGSGTTTISGSNTYTGATTISAGTMLVAGTVTSSAFTAASGGTLAGTGTVGGVTVDAGGILAPGNSSGLGILATGNLGLSGTLAATINGTTVSTQYNQANVTGTVTLLSGNDITLSLGFTPTIGDNFFLIRNDGVDAITGLLAGHAQNSSFTLSGQVWKISYVGDFATNSFTGGNDLVIQAIPEPGTFALLAFSLATIMALRRRSNHG